MDEKERDFLIFYMDQTWQEMRHLETLRERMTIFVITLASTATGFIMQQKFSAETQPLKWLVIALGIFGLLLSFKLFQLHQMGQGRLNRWYQYYSSKLAKSEILALRDEADKINLGRFSYLQGIKHSHFWTVINALVIIAGILLLAYT